MARDEQDVIVVEREGTSGLKWLLLGAAVGAGLALLFAPRDGREIRRELGRGIRSLRALADDTIEQLRGERRDEESDLRSMADAGGAYDEGEPSPEREVAEAPRRTGSAAAREELERRLAAARARRRSGAPDEEEPVA